MPVLRACGARPSRGRAKVRWPCGEGLEIARKGFFSEGRGLRARVVRPHVRRDISFPPHALTMTRWPKGGNVGVGVVPSLRACRARPSAKPEPPQGGPAASKRDASERRDADITGVQSPPLQGGERRTDGLAGMCPG